MAVRALATHTALQRASRAPGTAGISGGGGAGSRFRQESQENRQFICKDAKTKTWLKVVFGE